MQTRGWTKEQDNKLIEFCNAKTFISAREMSKEIGKGVRTIQARMKTLNIKRNSFAWTEEQDEILIKLYPNCKVPIDTIVNEVNKVKGALNRTRESVFLRASALGLRRQTNSNEIKEYLVKYYREDGVTAKDIAEKFDRPIKTIYRLASDLNLTNEMKVTTKQVQYIIKHYRTKNVNIMAAELGVPVHSIRSIAYKHNIRKPRKQRKDKVKKEKLWNEQREEFIKENYQHMTMQQISQELKIPYSKVKSKIASMGLRDKNLKVYSVGNISFKYCNNDEKQAKKEYAIMFRELINEARIGDMYR